MRALKISTPIRHRKMLASCLTLLALLSAGCGSQAKRSHLPSVAISANPASISAGSSSTLTVTAADATQVIVTGTDGSSYTLPANGGTQSVSPTATTTYTVTATGSGGTATATATLTVAANPPPTVTITASPASIASGSSSILTVAATNAAQVTVTGSDGSSYTLQPSGGTQSVSPTTTTTYTAVATGSGGKASASTKLTVTPNPAPTATITANPTSITAGSSSILTVTATNATQVTVTGSDGSSYPLSVTGGTQAVTPASNTTYTATATGAGGKASASVSITVKPNPPPTVTITAQPASIIQGGSSTLTVTAVNATQVTVTGNDGSSYTLQSSGGGQTVSPSTTTIYTATATGPGGNVSAEATVTVTPNPTPTVSITANPATITAGNPSTLTVTATNATQVTVTGTDNSSYTLQPSGGTQDVSPASTTSYTATATGASGSVTASTTVTVQPAGSIQDIDHVIFMLQENHTFDNYFGMLNPYRVAKGWTTSEDGKQYSVDGIDDKLTTLVNDDDEGTAYHPFKFKSVCIDDESSDWIASYGDVNRYDFSATRSINMDGFVHNAEGYAKTCASSGSCSGSFTDLTGERAMGYYDQNTLNYYYYMASQFALSDRWFSPVSDNSVGNRIATFTGGTTQGLVHDPGNQDHLSQLGILTIFQELQNAGVSWKIYYTATQGFCLQDDDCPPGAAGTNEYYPATYFSNLSYSYNFLRGMPSSGVCPYPLQPSNLIGDPDNSFCIDLNHIAPLEDPTYGYFADLKNGTLPSFSFIEAGYGRNDEHPGSAQNILVGQAEVASIVNALMATSGTPNDEWKDSVFFLSYDEGGGPYDHVPPVPGHSNDFTDAAVAGLYPDISSIAVNPDGYNPCVPPGGTPTTHCDLKPGEPGSTSTDAAAQQGFAAQLGFRVPNIVISPFTRKHYVSHVPMDHTAVIKFVENRFIGPSAHLTARDAAQPNLLDFFDFANPPWLTPPTPPTPLSPSSGSCSPSDMGP